MTEGEERELLALVASLDFHEIRMHGVVARRTTAHFGVLYGYQSRKVEPAAPIPEGLVSLRDRCAGLAGVDPPERFVEALITRYPPGAGIGWHRDAPMFGSRVAGVSLGGAARMRFRRDGHEPHVLPLEPRSAYVLAGEARWQWQHTIPAGKQLRYSITFRTLHQPEIGAVGVG
ncbi:MAG: alpha-ketoglutarate-dependent dioxygenase AlkB [Actinomycetota bacterium]